jgi:hypothetical protein
VNSVVKSMFVVVVASKMESRREVRSLDAGTGHGVALILRSIVYLLIDNNLGDIIQNMGIFDGFVLLQKMRAMRLFGCFDLLVDAATTFWRHVNSRG